MALAKTFLVILVLASSTVQAQDWPTRPVRMVVAFPPGGSTDIAVRVLAERIAPALGQPVLVENRAGASGNVAAEFVLKQPADGHLVLATADALAEPSVRERFAQYGLEAVGGTPQDFARLYREDYEKYARLTRELNIKLD